MSRKNGRKEEKREISIEDKYAQLLARYNSLVKAVGHIEKERDELAKSNSFYQEQLNNAELNIVQQKDTLINVVTNSNQTKEDMAKEISKLRAKIKVLKDGNNY